MTARELAEAMLQWGELREKLDALEQVISAEVLKLEKTQTVGNVRATFSGGRTQWDYEAAVLDKLGDDAYDKAKSFQKVTVDWKRMCDDLRIDSESYIKSASGPSVTVKFMGGGQSSGG